MEFEDAFSKQRDRWMRKNKRALLVLGSSALQDALVASGAPHGLRMVLSSGRAPTFQQKGQAAFHLEIVQEGGTWLHINSVMLRLLNRCHRDPAYTSLLYSYPESYWLSVLKHIANEKALKEPPVPTEASIFGSLTNVKAGRQRRVVLVNPLGFQPDRLDSHGMGSYYHDAVDRFRAILNAMLQSS